MASVQANGITIEFEEQGSGEPLLLVMGLGGQLIDWPQALVDRLAEQFRVIRFDNRDSGLSTEFQGVAPTRAQLVRAMLRRKPGAAEYLLSDMADDAVGLLDALGIESAHVMGVSMGGMISQEMAIRHPARVRSLVSIMSTTGNRRVGQPSVKLIRTTMRRPVPTRATAVEAGVALFRDVCGPTFNDDDFRELARVAIDRSYRPEGTARQTAAIMASGDRTAALAKITAPTLVVHGLLDPLVRPSGGMATARAIPNSRLLMFNDMAHDLPHTRFDEMVDAIVANVARAAQPVPA